ncbi:MAG TPA: beta-ketoacyl-ACP synthase [Nitrospinota bacterium]|nr:beta-ketoacyl-ACP synthase [Nitrospinota bacterium]
MKPLALTSYTSLSAVGKGLSSLRTALLEERTGLAPIDLDFARGLDTYIGRVNNIENSPIVDKLKRFDCRNNRLAQMCILQDGFKESIHKAIEKYGSNRISLVIGTSTSGILETELAYNNSLLRDESEIEFFSNKLRYTHCFFSPAEFISEYFGLTGPALTISTACSSSAKAFASAARHIEAGFADAAIVGGVDSLCMTTLYGFSSLNIVSTKPCKPCDRNRDGLSLGEAAGFALLEKPGEANSGMEEIFLSGYGESSDAHHMSAPHPKGAGAELAMRGALEMSNIRPEDVDYINMHGTATPANDTIEASAISRIFGPDTPCSSTKGWTGHTLGAAGIVESLIAVVSLKSGIIPGCLNMIEIDPEIQANVIDTTVKAGISNVLVNSFGFGGNNCSLILEMK